jgi:hypothetical protein
MLGGRLRGDHAFVRFFGLGYLHAISTFSLGRVKRGIGLIDQFLGGPVPPLAADKQS